LFRNPPTREGLKSQKQKDEKNTSRSDLYIGTNFFQLGNFFSERGGESLTGVCFRMFYKNSIFETIFGVKSVCFPHLTIGKPSKMTIFGVKRFFFPPPDYRKSFKNDDFLGENRVFPPIGLSVKPSKMSNFRVKRCFSPHLTISKPSKMTIFRVKSVFFPPDSSRNLQK